MGQQELDDLKKELEVKMLECSVSMKNDIRDALVEVNRIAEMFETHKHDVKSGFQKQELQRQSMNDELKGMITELFQAQQQLFEAHKISDKKFNEHSDEEMDIYHEVKLALDLLSEKIEKLNQETDENSEYISKAEQEAEIQRRIEEYEKNKPSKKYFDKVKITAITVATGTIVTGMLAIVWAVIIRK
jgi:hypothetical protein